MQAPPFYLWQKEIFLPSCGNLEPYWTFVDGRCMHVELVLILLFGAAIILSVIASRLYIPYTVALVLGGLLMGSLQLIEAPALTQELLFSLFLPGLIFEAAFHLPARELWRERLNVLGLAVPGVLISIVVTAAALVFGTRLLPNGLETVIPFTIALVFAATVAATDPISVVALFRELGAPSRLTLLVEGESLLNDGTAIVFFSLLLGLALGQHSSVAGLSLEFGKVVGGALIIGLVVGSLVSEAIKRVNDGMVEISLSLVAAWGSFLTADQLGYSGVISCVVAGLVCGNYGAPRGMSPSVRIAVNTFWEYIGFAFNSLVFLLVGFTIHLDTLLQFWPLILIAYVAITIARAAVIFAISALTSRTRVRIPLRWNFVLVWGGVRGALSMVLILALPAQFPERNLLVNLVFGVVLLTILVQGLTMTPVATWLGVIHPQRDRSKRAEERMRLHLAQHARAQLNQLRKEGLLGGEALRLLEAHYHRLGEQAREKLLQSVEDASESCEQEMIMVQRRLLLQNQQLLLEAWQKGEISKEVHDRLGADLDAELIALDSQPQNVLAQLREAVEAEQTKTGGV
ncbi:MAG: sodium:proton antiporter [Candidatus Igneacidithiobacillus chanchocoensis]